MEPVKTVRNGKTYINYNVGLLVNHGVEDLSKWTEEFVVKAQVWEKKGLFRKLTPRMQTLGTVKFSDFMDMGGYAYFECGFWWPEEAGVDGLQLLYVSKKDADGKDEIPVTGLLPLEFQYAAHVPKDKSRSGNKGDFPKIEAESPINGKGRWHLSHRFKADVDGNNLIYLWRYTVPALIESHSHVMSNHCATLPAIWEKNGLLAMLEPGYSFQDWMGPKVKGEMVSLSIASTSVVAKKFHQHLKKSPYVQAFPFLATKAYSVGTVLSMDMDFMHYLGYDGVPIIRDHQGTKWYCWNKKWKRTTNNTETYHAAPHGGVIQVPRPYESMPTSVDGESWHFMSSNDADKYEPWVKQRAEYKDVLKETSKDTQSMVAPLLHFDPRRYCGRGTGLDTVDDLFARTLHGGGKDFIGIKLYTAMGWAPMDPLLKNPLMEFYNRCESDQIPLVNHCSPAGFYTHDRKYYFDLHKEKGRLDTTDRPDGDGWPTRFKNWAETPRNTYWHRNGVKIEPFTEKEKIWWYCQHYVNPQSWSSVIRKHPKLKLCFAHFASSDHLEEKSGWDTRKQREPENAPHVLTIGFDGGKLDPSRTHSFLFQLFEMIQPENRVFTDLSYVTLNDENANNFTKLFKWASEFKPILLERILWGTDWPLIGDEEMVTSADVSGFKDPPLLYKYAKGFVDRAKGYPEDFFVRSCFLNPMQFWRMDILKSKAPSVFRKDWIDSIPASILDDYSGDKVKQLYRQNPSLFEAPTF